MAISLAGLGSTSTVSIRPN